MLTTLPMPSMSGTMYTRKPSSWGMGLARNWSSAEAGVWAGSAVARQSRAGSRAERTIIFPRGVGVAPVKSPLPGRKRQRGALLPLRGSQPRLGALEPPSGATLHGCASARAGRMPQMPGAPRHWRMHRLYAHLVWTTRQRLPLITADRARMLDRYLRVTAGYHHARVLAVGMVSTHVHVLLRFESTTALAVLVQALKGGSATVLNRELHDGPPLR